MEEQFEAVESVETEVQETPVETEAVADDQPGTESETEAANTEQPESTEELLFNDDMEIDLGEGRNPVKFAELKNGYLRQSDYTKKTQELAAQRQEFETLQQEYEPVKGWLEYIQQNPYLFNTINQAIEQWNNLGEPIELEAVLDTEAGPYINHLISRVSELESELNRVSGEYQETKFGTEMNGVLSELKAEYKELLTPEYEQSLMQQAKEQGLSPELVKRIAKGDLAEMKLKSATSQKQKQQIEAETIKKIQQNAVSSTGSLGQEGAEHNSSYSAMSAADKKALRERVLRGEHVQL